MMETQISTQTARPGTPTDTALAGTDRDAYRETIKQLETALQSRIVIEQAKGILAERFDLNVEEAFLLLRYAARSGRMPIRTLAVAVIGHPETTPEQIAASLAQPERWRHGRVGAPSA